MIDSITQDVLNFWYGKPSQSDYGQFRMWWFQKSHETDEKIRNKFAQLHQELMEGKHKDMLGIPEGYMAQILVLDQFSRNIFRNSPRAFSSDAKALSLAREAVSKGYDKKLPKFMRSFLYLPYEHSEALEDQHESVRLFEELGEPENLDYAIQHKVIIEKFGRYPHRNEVLGRTNTPEEIQFLKQPGSGF